MSRVDDIRAAQRLAAEQAAGALRDAVDELDSEGQVAAGAIALSLTMSYELRRAYITLAVELYKRAEIRCCRVCACTEDDACDGGCSWTGPDLCSSCDG